MLPSGHLPPHQSEHPAPQVKAPSRGGVDSHIAARTSRSSNGSLVLGQSQDCYGAQRCVLCCAVVLLCCDPCCAVRSAGAVLC